MGEEILSSKEREKKEPPRRIEIWKDSSVSWYQILGTKASGHRSDSLLWAREACFLCQVSRAYQLPAAHEFYLSSLLYFFSYPTPPPRLRAARECLQLNRTHALNVHLYTLNCTCMPPTVRLLFSFLFTTKEKAAKNFLCYFTCVLYLYASLFLTCVLSYTLLCLFSI